MKTLFIISSVLLLSLANRAQATNYHVGPGQPLAALSNVPWANLQPGDFVNIHYKSGGYHEKIQISASGTAAQHVVIRGIPDPATGALPIIDGKDAIEDPSIDFSYPKFSEWGVIVVSPRQSTYIYGAYHVSFVDIETLDIRNATYSGDGSVTYTDQFGNVRGYGTFACGIYIEWAHDLAVRGCEISNCGLGVYANSKFGVVKGSQRLLIEKNYFHDNSNPYIADPANPNGAPLSNGFGEHHIYTESAGCVIQYNRFGKLRPNAHGTAIKDRSSGEIIRYNEFDMDGQSAVLAMLDPQGGIDFIDTQPDYLDSFVYGNVITVENYSGGITGIQWGAYNSPGNLPDGRSSYATLHRRTLYFYNNTVVTHNGGTTLFFMPDKNYTGTNPTYENVDCRNNVIFSDTTIQSNIYNALRFLAGGTANSGGDVNLGVNWISPNWRKDAPGHTWSGALNGSANLLVGDSSNANDPHFVNINAHDYHVLIPGNILDAAGSAAAATLTANAVTQEYLSPQSSQNRVTQSTALDLGALESTGLASPPPAAGALQFTLGSYSISEACSTAAITVTRVGGTTGAVGVSYSTPLGGTALDGSDYTSVVGTLTWADGESSPKTFYLPIINDTEIELAETVNFTLFNPTGGAVLGTLATATLTIQDNDTPPSVLMYGLGNISNALFLFKSNAPGTMLSYTIPSGLVSGDSLRALAVQPITGKLFAVGTARVLYTLNPFSGAATAVGSVFTPALTSDTMDLTFDRITGLLKLITSSGQNMNLSPVTGQVLSVDTALNFTAGDVNAGIAPQVAGADFSVFNGVQTLYGFDAGKDAFVRINPTNGQVTTIGSLGYDTSAQAALKIPEGATYGWAVMGLPLVNNTPNSGLFAINLSKGNAVSIGTLRGSENVRDIVVAPPRDNWKQTRYGTNVGNALIAADLADPDHNGFSNLMEYALGMPAIGNGKVPAPLTGFTGNYLTLSFTRPTSASDIIYTVQVSDDMVNWQDGSTYSATGDIPDTTYTTQVLRTISNGIETINVRDNVSSSTTAKRFMRLKVLAQ
jgi:Domain of unknown function (DUF4394)/Calx-beta domain/Right handed beta helix region